MFGKQRGGKQAKGLYNPSAFSFPEHHPERRSPAERCQGKWLGPRAVTSPSRRLDITQCTQTSSAEIYLGLCPLQFLNEHCSTKMIVAFSFPLYLILRTKLRCGLAWGEEERKTEQNLCVPCTICLYYIHSPGLAVLFQRCNLAISSELRIYFYLGTRDPSTFCGSLWRGDFSSDGIFRAAGGAWKCI